MDFDNILGDRDDIFRVNCFYLTLDSIMTELRSSASNYESNIKAFISLTTLDSQNRSDEDLRRETDYVLKVSKTIKITIKILYGRYKC